MDSGTTPLQSPGFLGTLTTVHFAIIAVLAVLTIIGIAYGMKLARARRQGVRELEDAGHLERGDAPVREAEVATPVRQAVPVERAPEPVAPAERVSEPAVAQAPTVSPVPVDPAPEPIIPPASAATVTAPPAPTANETDLTRLKGLGPKVAAMLVEQGVPDIATLATLDPARADAVAAQLGMFSPRMTKDRWVEQAQLLATGNVTGFEAKFGKL